MIGYVNTIKIEFKGTLWLGRNSIIGFKILRSHLKVFNCISETFVIFGWIKKPQTNMKGMETQGLCMNLVGHAGGAAALCMVVANLDVAWSE